MSTLKLDTLSNKAGTASVPSDTIVSGTAKAWVNFNGTGTVAIRRAFNVSSITDNGQGYYTVNLINPVADANGACVASLHNSDNGGGGDTYPNFQQNNVFIWAWTYGTSAIRVRTAWGNNINYDAYHAYVAIFS